jgi:3-methylcrotonyl-CoA carboxylase alpha subunit
MPTTHGDDPGGDGTVHVFREGHDFTFLFGSASFGGRQSASDGAIMAPMPGRVVAVEVAQGAVVSAGERLVVLEAMKMEQALVAPFDGVVADLRVVAGAQVSEGTLLVRIERGEG